jgi:hypothetical protein
MVHYDQNVMGIALELLQAILAASHSPSRNAVLNSQLVSPQTGTPLSLSLFLSLSLSLSSCACRASVLCVRCVSCCFTLLTCVALNDSA